MSSLLHQDLPLASRAVPPDASPAAPSGDAPPARLRALARALAAAGLALAGTCGTPVGRAAEPASTTEAPGAPATTSSPLDDLAMQKRPVRTRIGFERVRLPGHEGMGLTGMTELMGVGGDWWAGAGVYGATTGHRGGLFVPGVELAWSPVLSDTWALDAGVFAGGGGGANAPVGGGLMLRPHVDLVWRPVPGFFTGPTASLVRFAHGGQISSAQLGWMLGVGSDFDFRFADALSSRSARGGSGGADALGFQRIDATLTAYQPRSGATRLDGTPLGRVGLVGMRADRALGEVPWWGIEAAGAATGGVAGYAEVLGTAGLRWRLPTDRVTLGVRGAMGLGGGGGIDTGGGVLLKGSGALTLRLTDTLDVTAEAGLAHAPTGHFTARTASLALDWTLDSASDYSGVGRESTRMEYVAGVERYDAARRTGGGRPLAAGILSVNRFITPVFYVTGQAHSAFLGGAGAYSVGLFGVGAQVPVLPRVRLGAEALAGAAGGGGVDTQGGALVQGRGYVDVALTPTVSFRVGAGRVKSVHGGVNATDVDAALVFRFGVDRAR